MKNYNIYITDRKTNESFILESGVTERQAESFCESWGWFYCDENGKTWYLGYGIETENYN